MQKIELTVPTVTPSDCLDRFLRYGVKSKKVPKWYPCARTVLYLIEQQGYKEDMAEKLFSSFLDKVFPDKDVCDEVRAVAMDILYNPELTRGHYRTFNIRKKDGGFRLIEAPEKPLKSLQRAILHNWWYAHARPVPNVQGFVPKRGTLTNAGMHVKDGVMGKDKVLIKTDIRDFFMSITRTSVMNRIMNDSGYLLQQMTDNKKVKFPSVLLEIMKEHLEGLPCIPDDVLDEIAKSGVSMKTHSVHARVLVVCKTLLDWILLRLCCLDERLPQGSPCSPALANIFMKGFVNILQAKLKEKVTCPFTSTIYADDITTTIGPDANDNDILEARRLMVSCIMQYTDISVNYKKIGVFRHGHSQKVTGIMITDKLSISRQDRDKVRAELHSAATGKKDLTDEDKMRLRGVRAWMRGVDQKGWDSRCERDFLKAVGK